MSTLRTKLEKEIGTVVELTEYPDGSFNTVTYSNRAVSEGYELTVDGKNLVCARTIDVTTDNEREDGISFTKMEFELNTK